MRVHSILTASSVSPIHAFTRSSHIFRLPNSAVRLHSELPLHQAAKRAILRRLSRAPVTKGVVQIDDNVLHKNLGFPSCRSLNCHLEITSSLSLSAQFKLHHSFFDTQKIKPCISRLCAHNKPTNPCPPPTAHRPLASDKPQSIDHNTHKENTMKTPSQMSTDP